MLKRLFSYSSMQVMRFAATSVPDSVKKGVFMRVAFSFLILLAATQTYGFAVSSIDTLKAKLDGRWEWVETYGGYSGETYTPRSEHYSLALVLSKNVPRPNSDSIAYQVYRNDTLILSGFTTLSSSTVQIQAFGPGNHIQGQIVCTKDTLQLATFILDGYSSTFIRPDTSLKMVRGTISDSATGTPIGNVKVVLMQMAGEIEEMLDSSRTGTSGSYSFAFSGRSGGLLYIYTISDKHFYQSTSLGSLDIDDTITKDIKLKLIPTMVSAAPHSATLQNNTVRTAQSRLYLSGIKTGAIVRICNLNGRLLFKTTVTAGASEVMVPEWIAAAGCYQVSIMANGRQMHGMIRSR